jgi:hypothetical protein
VLIVLVKKPCREAYLAGAKTRQRVKMGDVVEAIRDVKGTPEHQSGTQQQPADQDDDVKRAND